AKAFLFEKLEANPDGFVIRDLPGVVDHDTLEVLRDAALSDALGYGAAFGLELARGVVTVKCRPRRVCEANLNVLALGLEANGDATQRSPGTDGAAEAIHLSARLFPDFLGRCLDVSLAVGNIVELVRPDRAIGLGFREGFGKTCGVLHVVVRIPVWDRGHFHQGGAEQAQRVFLLLRLGLRNDDHRPEAHGGADYRQADARIARRAFHDRPAG